MNYSTRKIVSSHEFVFYKTFSSALAYTPRPYSEALAIWPAVSYFPYATLSHGQTGNIISFAQFEEGKSVENEHGVAEYESVLASIDYSYIYDDCDDGYISTNSLEGIWGGKHLHPYINAIYARLKIHDCIKQLKIE